MEIKKINNYSETAKIMVDVKNLISQHIAVLEEFLSHLQENKKKNYNEYLEAFVIKFSSLSSKVDENTIQRLNLANEMKIYSEYQKLYANYVISLLKIPENYSEENMELDWYNYEMASLYPFYYRALTLCDVIGKELAIEYLKDFINYLHYKRIKPNLELKNLDHLWEEGESENPYPGDFIAVRFNKGKFAARVDKCIGHEVMNLLDDPELAYIVSCYGDFAKMEAQNPNFVFTMEKTLIAGDPYCTKCTHDKRHINKIEHPSNEFWENLDFMLEK